MFISLAIATIILIILSLVIYHEIQEKKLLETVTRPHRGTSAERALVLKLLKAGVPAHSIFHDLYLKKPDNNYCQIDLVVATNVGIIVIEVKDYSGWIFGTGHHQYWTQVLAYGKSKYQFYNPVLQNNKHISDLKQQVQQFENIPFYSLIVFYGNCEFKKIYAIPYDTFLIKPSDVNQMMKRIVDNNVAAKYVNGDKVANLLNEAVRNGESKEIRVQHVQNIKSMLGKGRNFK